MAFYGPTFPNETHYDKLFSGRQRFGNRSANMFFVRPARHIACPRRLKYIHDIKTGIIPYVEDSIYDHRPAYGFGTPKYDDDKHKSNGLGLYNSSDVWRQELMELAQQVKTSLIVSDDQDTFYHSPRTSRLQRHHPHSHSNKRSTSSVLSNYSEDNDDNQPNKRLLNRRISQQSFQRVQSTKPKSSAEKSDHDLSNNLDESQDSGIWLIPILCYVLQIDSIAEAQEWLANANPTEKRLAMELISRTMQDMQNYDHDLSSDVSSPDSTTNSGGFNNVYWPYKVWQRKEKHRHHTSKLSKSSSQTILPSISTDNLALGDTCERATSPLRMLTPAKRATTSLNHSHLTPVDTMTAERSMTRQTIERTSPSAQQPTQQQQQQQQQQQRSPSPLLPKNASSTMNSSMTTPTNKPERQSRRGYRVATSMNHSVNQSTHRTSPVARGKTPLI